MIALTAPGRWVTSHFIRPRRYRWGRWRSGPDAAGVREPRRPKPTLPAAAVALAEPRTEVRHRLKRRGTRLS